MNARQLVELDRWLTTPPDDDEIIGVKLSIYTPMLDGERAARVERFVELEDKEDEVDATDRAIEWAIVWCSENGYAYDDCDVDIEDVYDD